MSKFTHDDVLDAGIDLIIAEGEKVLLFDAYSEVYATINANKIAEFTPTISKANGDSSGRKAIIAAAADVNIDSAGFYNHFAIVNVSGTKIRHIGQGTRREFFVGDKVNFPQTDIEFSDPT